MNSSKWKKKLILCLPYIIVGLICTNFGEAWRLAEGVNASEKLQDVFQSGTLQTAFQNLLPSLYPTDLIVGIVCGAAFRLAVYLKGKNEKKYRQGEEYGSARWGTHADIEPFEDPEFENNVILSQTERITMSSRPPVRKYARNKNILVVGGSGSGKTRFVLKPNLLQCCSKKYPVSFVITDPKGSIVNESAHALVVNGYEIRIFNTINFHKSMHYNPFAYIHDEKDILKLVTTLMANTKGEGNGGDPFWEKSEKLLYTALIGYIHYEAPVEEQNFATLLEMLNSMEVREDDETFKNPVDLLFDELEQTEPEHFAVRQFRKYKLAAGVISLKRLLNHHFLRNWSSKMIKKSLEAYFLPKTRNCTFLKTFSKDGNILPRQSGYSVRNFSNRHKIQRNLKKLRYYLVKQRPKDGLSERNFFEDPYTNLDNGAACP